MQQAKQGDKRRQGRVLLAANVWYWVCSGLFVPFLTAFLSRRGLTQAEVGLVLTTMPLCSIFVQPLWSGLADRHGARKLVLFLLCVASALVAPLIGLSYTFSVACLTVLAFSVLFQALLPLCDSLVVEGCARNGADFSRVRMGGTIGYAIVAAVDGYFLEAFPRLQFLVVSAGLLLFAFTVSRLPQQWHEPVAEPAQAASAPTERPRGLRALFDTDDIVLVLVLAFVTYLGIGFHGSYLGGYVVELGYGQDLVGVLCAISASSEIPVLILINRLIDRFGTRRLLYVACLATTLRLVLVGTGLVPLMAVAQLLQGPGYMFTYYCAVTFISRHARPGCEARGQSLLVMVQAGFATVAANLLGGLLGDALGLGATFELFGLATLVLTGVAFVLSRGMRGRAVARS